MIDNWSQNPLWMYDFTLRSRTWNHLWYKVGRPVGIYEEYFGNDFNKWSEKEPDTYILVPDFLQRNRDSNK